jgi:uncharacterized protein (TIGR01732 family)|nr:YjcZ family sporulation protein [Bacillus alveayuensis]
MSDGAYAGSGFALIVVLFVLLIIVGCGCMIGGFGGYGRGYGFGGYGPGFGF